MTYRFFVAKMHYSPRKYIFLFKVIANVHFSLLKEPGYCVDSSMAYGGLASDFKCQDRGKGKENFEVPNSQTF